LWKTAATLILIATGAAALASQCDQPGCPAIPDMTTGDNTSCGNGGSGGPKRPVPPGPGGGGGGGGGGNPPPTATATPTSSPPAFTVSRYMDTVNLTASFDLGCERALSMANGIYVLAYGQPALQGGVYGAYIFGSGSPFASVSAISAAAKEFAHGFHLCSNTSQRMTLAIGTSNFAGGNPWGTSQYYDHGREWALMVNDVGDYVDDLGWSTKIKIAGANNIEVQWNTPANTIAWANGYDSSNSHAYYNFGNTAGCPEIYSGNQQCVAGGFTWYQEDIWRVSWDIGAAFPLPEIYLTSGANARQWQAIAEHAVEAHFEQMIFAGTFTQYIACLETQAPECSQTNNLPNVGWQQLYFWLATNPQTAQSVLDWATDVSWEH
jgi:hypothetical protein